jgi:2-desacetyl-2-hydroxyethyl bacteriochlorophyllide A dehydrogenase
VKSVLVISPGEFEYTDSPPPTPSGDAIVRVTQVGICGTDLKILNGGIPVEYPRIMGHEMIGEIIDPGDTGMAEGQRVLIDPGIACGSCDMCRRGRRNICLRGGLMGRDVDGVFAELATAPANRLLAVPETIGQTAAGVLQVLGTVVHAQRRARVFPGDVVVVIGLGVSGILFVQLLRSLGATVVGVSRSEWKRDLASRLGAHRASPPDQAATLVAEVSGGHGADLCIEAVGTEPTLVQAIELTRVGGKVLVFGTVTKGDGRLPYYQLYFKELTILNPRAALASDYERGIALAASGVLDLESIVTDQLHLSDAAQAFDLVKASASLKVLMEVG